MLVIIESPYAANIQQNIEYAILCLKDSIKKGETPFASHLLYTLVTCEEIPAERQLGINMGFEWAKHAEKTVVYTDFGISPGMEEGIKNALENKRQIEYRKIL